MTSNELWSLDPTQTGGNTEGTSFEFAPDRSNEALDDLDEFEIDQLVVLLEGPFL